jgi:hypothetical protein
LDQLLVLLMAQDPALRSLRRGLKNLTRFTVEYRYPGLNATKRHVQSSLRHAQRVRQAIRQRLGLDAHRTP